MKLFNLHYFLDHVRNKMIPLVKTNVLAAQFTIVHKKAAILDDKTRYGLLNCFLPREIFVWVGYFCLT